MRIKIAVPVSLCDPGHLSVKQWTGSLKKRGEECCCRIDKRGNMVMHLESRDGGIVAVLLQSYGQSVVDYECMLYVWC